MNVSKFVVLGALEILGQGGGYDVNRVLQERQIHRWTGIQKASVYHALKSLLKSGHVQIVERLQNGAYPEKTIYEVTELGRTLYLDLQRQAAHGLYPLHYGFKLALKFNIHRSHEEMHQLALEAIEHIDTILANMERYLSTVDDPSQRALDELFIGHDQRLLYEERAWILESVEQYFALKSEPKGPSK